MVFTVVSFVRPNALCNVVKTEGSYQGRIIHDYHEACEAEASGTGPGLPGKSTTKIYKVDHFGPQNFQKRKFAFKPQGRRDHDPALRGSYKG